MALDQKLEEKIQEFVRRGRAAAEANLEGILLFGSAVSGDFHPGLSNLNLFCVLRDSSYARLQELAPVAKWWNDQKQPPPLCMTTAELQRSTDVFTIELLDMVRHHRVLYGTDVLQGLTIDTHLHRVQVEYELREKLVLLRQHLLLAQGNTARLWDVLLRSVSSFATLFRHAVMALGAELPVRNREAIDQLGRQVNFDSGLIQQVLDVREGKTDGKKLDVHDLCARYVGAVEKVAGAVDAALELAGG